MAITVDELKYILSLDPTRMRAELEKVDQRVNQTRNRTEKPLKVNVDIKGITASFAQLGLAIQGFRALQQSLSQPIANANRAYLEQDKSIRQIEAASKLTGTSLLSLQTISKSIAVEFKLTTQQANEFVVAANKLTSATGDIDKTETLLRRLFDLAAAQGLGASEALLRLNQSIKGLDEGTEALFSGKNPVDLYKDFAAQIGTTAAKMDDVQKKQAIINAILSDGAKLQGEYNTYLESAAGAQTQNAAAVEALRAELGQLLNAVYVPLLQTLTPIIKGLTEMDPALRNAGLAALTFVGVASRMPALLTAIRAGITGIASASGIGLLITVLGTVSAAFAAFNETTEKTTDHIENESIKFNGLVNSLIRLQKQETLTNEQRQRRNQLFSELQRQYPQYFANLDIEKAKIEDLETIQKNLNAEIEERIRLNAIEEQATNALKEATNAQIRYNKAVKEQGIAEELARRAQELRLNPNYAIFNEDKIKEEKEKASQFINEVLGETATFAATPLAQLNQKLRAISEDNRKRAKELNEEIVSLDETVKSQTNNYKQLQTELGKVLTGLEVDTTKKTDAIRKKEFDTNQITLAQYKTYLEERTATVKAQLGEESAEYKKLLVELNKINAAADALKKSESEKLDALRKYEYDSNRLTLEQYIKFLESRVNATKQRFGEESAEYLRFIDTINQLQSRLQIGLSQENIPTLDLQFRETGASAVEDKLKELTQIRSLEVDFSQLSENDAATLYDIRRRLLDEQLKYTEEKYTQDSKLYENLLTQKQALDEQYNNRRQTLEDQRTIETEFAQLGFEDLLLQYQQRQALIDSQLDYVRQKYGEENDIYKNLLAQKLAADQSYQSNKLKLESEGAKASLNVLTQFLTGFQSQSKVLFEMGKSASIAQAVINTYEGATKALAAYPPPFNAIAAAATIALGLQQVVQIKKQNYQPAAKATGGYIFEKDVLKSAITPPGESGIIGIQTGEFVINRRATAQFLPVLEAINSGRIKRGQISGYATGGVVTATQPAQNTFGIDAAVLAGAVQDAIVDGFSQSALTVNGTLSGAGKDLQTVLDTVSNLKSTL